MRFFPWSRASKPQFDAPLAPEETAVVIGDIHGRADLLERMLERVAGLGLPDARVICVGDYIDRGDESAAVLRRVHALQEADSARTICLMGNHEEMMLRFLDEPETWGARWMRHGGLQTLASFGVGLGPETTEGRDWAAVGTALRAALGPDLEAWLEALPLSWTSGNLFVAHAGANPRRPLDDQDPHGLLWGGEGFYETPRSDGVWVAHGHVITEEARAARGRIALDTGAYATGRLTAALIGPNRLEFLEA